MQAEDIKLTLKQIVESKEVKDLSEQLFKRLDEAALTPNGKIKTYRIDENMLKVNPMGGISLRFIINDDEDIVLFSSLGKVFKLPVHKIPLSDKNSNGNDIRLLNKYLTPDIACAIPESTLNKMVESKTYSYLFLCCRLV